MPHSAPALARPCAASTFSIRSWCAGDEYVTGLVGREYVTGLVGSEYVTGLLGRKYVTELLGR
eukprot:6583813-Pyramimonas_sp.AAC.2